MILYYPYFYLFYRLVKLNDYLFPKYKHHDNFPVVAMVSSCQVINILSIKYLLESLIDFKILRNSLILSVMVVLILGINSFIFLYKGKDKKIITQFENETGKQRNIGIILMWVYIIGTYVFLFYSFS